MSNRNRKLLSGLLLSFLAGACDQPIDEPMAGATERIIGGTEVVGDDFGPVALRYGSLGTCSGVLITNQWVLTAKHCVRFDPLKVDPMLLRVTTPHHTAYAAKIVPHDTLDVAMVKLDAPLPIAGSTTTFTQTLYTGPATALIGQNVECYGYGNSAIKDGKEVGSGVFRKATLPVLPVTNLTRVVIGKNASGQRLAHGDSGGPCYALIGGSPFLATINLHYYFPLGEEAVQAVPISEVAGWVAATLVTTLPLPAPMPTAIPFVGDFNGDKLVDTIYAFPDLAGSGGEQTAIYAPAGDPPQIIPAPCAGSDAAPVVGDFNGDLRDDLLCRHPASGENVLRLAGKPGAAEPFEAPLAKGVFCAGKKLFAARLDADAREDLLCYDDTAAAGQIAVRKSSPAAVDGFASPDKLGSFCGKGRQLFVEPVDKDDTLADLVCHDPLSGQMEVSRNVLGLVKGSTWKSVAPFCREPSDGRAYMFDANGDGRGDLFCHHHDGTLSYNHASVRGRFPNPTFRYSKSGFCAKDLLVFGDVSADGRLDLLCVPDLITSFDPFEALVDLHKLDNEQGYVRVAEDVVWHFGRIVGKPSIRELRAAIVGSAAGDTRYNWTPSAEELESLPQPEPGQSLLIVRVDAPDAVDAPPLALLTLDLRKLELGVPVLHELDGFALELVLEPADPADLDPEVPSNGQPVQLRLGLLE